MALYTIVTNSPISGDQLLSELTALGLPVIDVSRSADGAVVLVRTSQDLSEGNQILLATAVASHVPPAPKTPEEKRREAARDFLESMPDAVSLLIRAVVLEVIDAMRAERQAYAALRADVIAGRSGGAVTAPPLAVPTVQQAVDAILSRVDTLTS